MDDAFDRNSFLLPIEALQLVNLKIYFNIITLPKYIFRSDLFTCLISRAMLMDFALHDDSSLLPAFSGFVERPVVEVASFAELILWMRRASLPCASTADEPFVSFQIGPDRPVSFIRCHKEEEIKTVLQLEHLQRNMIVFSKLQFYLSPHAGQPSALVLPLTICISFFGRSTQGHRQAAWR